MASLLVRRSQQSSQDGDARVHLPGRTAVFEKDSAGMGAVDRTAFAGVKEYLSHAVRKGYRDKVFDVGGGNFWKPLRVFEDIQLEIVLLCCRA